MTSHGFELEDEGVELALQEYWARLEAGEAVDLETFARERPALAQGLKTLHAPSRVMVRLCRQFSSRALEAETQPLAEDPARELVPGKYTLEAEHARGGMGVILRVWDQCLRRTLALKVLKTSTAGERESGTDARLLSRFLDEAQITGQLEHPGIVPVHDLGLDALGRLYYSMPLVRGHELTTIFEWAKRGEQGWSFARALGVLLKVCEAMAYAHARGVLHRDLKPANVMVGSFGETYVMDWGLAKVTGHVTTANGVVVATDRGDSTVAHGDSAFATMQGSVLGTPSYMAPEQARGAVDEIGPSTDVYAVGAMLYTLLAGRAPYVTSGAPLAGPEIIARVHAGPPTPVAQLNSRASAELIAICEKAMARDPARRYADMGEMADDLRASLEQRVVRAYQTGAVAELRKWVARNRASASVTGVALAILLAGSASFSIFAERRYREITQLSDLRLLNELKNDADRLYPVRPALLPELDSWITRAEEVLARLPKNRAALKAFVARGIDPAERVDPRRALELDDLRRRRAQFVAADGSPRLTLDEIGRDRLKKLENDITTLQQELAAPVRAASISTLEAWHAEKLSELVRRLEDEFDKPETGLLADVRRRREFARTVAERTTTGADARELWRTAIADIVASDKYHGLRITPQLGLLPLGKDPRTGLWEFWHVESGARPEPSGAEGEANHWRIRAETAVVLVLVPSGEFSMGAKKLEEGQEGGAHLDPWANANEQPVRTVSLAEFFVSKYELTQAQWQRVAGDNPSRNRPDNATKELPVEPTHPVEQVSWIEVERALARWGLVLPTEAQWEYAARAGTTTVWWTGENRETLRGAVNLADETAKKFNPQWSAVNDWPGFVDGFAVHAPVGSFRANPFGLHDVCGNVWEWCRDWHESYEMPVASHDGERLGLDRRHRVSRGGCMNNRAAGVRSALRGSGVPSDGSALIGARPARAIEVVP